MATRSTKGAPAVAQVRPVEVTAGALPTYAPGGSDAAVGRPAPEVRGAGFDAATVRIMHDGTPKLVMFVAHWCPHCQKEVPVVAGWTRTGQPEGVSVVAVSTGVDPIRPNYPPSAWLDREGWTVPTIADDGQGSAAAAYGLTAYPYFVAVRADGTVAARATGEQSVAQLQALAAAARGERAEG
jgi:thiol-disulfide isomerase/thioredoxin